MTEHFRVFPKPNSGKIDNSRKRRLPRQLIVKIVVQDEELWVGMGCVVIMDDLSDLFLAILGSFLFSRFAGLIAQCRIGSSLEEDNDCFCITG